VACHDNIYQLKCYITNARSLNNKLNDLQLFININDPDILVLTETWLEHSMPSSMFVDCNIFSVFRKDRPTRGGGVCMLIKNSPTTVVSQVAVPHGFEDLDIVAVDLKDCNNTLPIRLIAVYRPPSMTKHDNARLFSVLNLLAEDCVRLCVFGDLNLPLLNWDLFVYPDNFLYCTAVDFICNHGLTQLVNDPTRGDSILDLILCSDLLCCDNVNVLPPLANSDHSVVSCSLCISLPHSPHTDSSYAPYNYSKANWSGLCNYLSLVDWITEFGCCISVGDYWDTFVRIIFMGIDEFVPKYVRTRHTTSVKLYPRHVRSLFRKKNSYWKLYKQFRTNALYNKYKQMSKLCTKAVNDHVAGVENNLIADGKIGNFYKYVNKKLNGSNGIAPLLNTDGVLVFSDADKAVLLNDYFASVFTQDNGVIDSARLPRKNTAKMPASFFTPYDVSKCIKHLKRNGSAGPDNLPAEFYKVTDSFVRLPLSLMFNLSIQTGELPDIWRVASVTPIFKKGSPSDPANYRPISLTCVACKLLEIGIKTNLLNHLLRNNVISSSQHGFLSRKSTTTQLLECFLDWNIALNGRNQIDIIYLDYAKAFDSVVHSKLLAKLQSYGIDDLLLGWIRSFLVGRSQFVKIAAARSSAVCVVSGVPQGSVLGPVLFIVYINDICEVVPNGVSVKLFADDAKLYSVFGDTLTPECLQSCLTAISDWSNHWQLKLSPTKCSVLHVAPARTSSTSNNFPYHIDNVALPVVNFVTDLGVTYDNKLRFRPHIDRIVSKAALRAKLILKCFQSRDSGLLSRAFSTFVRPILEYGCIIWNPLHKCDICKIESVQRQFTKRLKGFYRLSYTCRLYRLGLDSLYCRRIKTDLIMCYKILNNLVCIDANLFFKRSVVCNTRGNSMKLNKCHIISSRYGNFFR